MAQKGGVQTRATAAAPTRLRNIVWLASYPKSGNTWARIFLANYLLAPSKPVPINEVHRIGIGDSVAPAYRRVAGGRYDPGDTMGHLRLREKVLRGVAANGADINFVKTHNALGRAFGVEMILPAYTRSAVYIVRNPLDVVVSYARHFGLTPAQAAEAISRADNTVAADQTSVAQYLGNWSEHVLGWTGARAFPVHVMRFEDMKADPRLAFSGLLGFLGVPVEDERLDRAIRFSSFDEMKRQEAASGFIERSQSGERFFHTGESGQWRETLADGHISRLHQLHGTVMARFGYL